MPDIKLPIPSMGSNTNKNIEALYDTILRYKKELEYVFMNLDRSNLNSINVTYGDIREDTKKLLKRDSINPNFKIRYIRDWVNGSDKNDSSHWYEIKVLSDKGINRALGLIPSYGGEGQPDTEYGHDDLSVVTDGDIGDTDFLDLRDGKSYVEIDLGMGYTDIDTIVVWHYWKDNRIYNESKVEVSEDGENWITLFDSNIDGTYKETINGHSIKVNTTNRLRTENTLIDDEGIKTNSINTRSPLVSMNEKLIYTDRIYIDVAGWYLIDYSECNYISSNISIFLYNDEGKNVSIRNKTSDSAEVRIGLGDTGYVDILVVGDNNILP